jgi:anti-sigma B factor antagonist
VAPGGAWNQDPVAAVWRDGDAVVVHLRGELDLANVERVREVLLEAARSDAARLVVDLGEVTFLDSTALGALVQARRALDERPLVLVAPVGDPRRALEVAGLLRHLTVHATLDDALGS